MAFREVTVVQIKEAIRRWMRGEGERTVAREVGVDRKTARRYIAAAIELGIERSGGEEQLTDELIGQLVERVRPHRPDGHGEAWRTLLNEEKQITAWLKDDLTVTKIGILLERRGVIVPHRTLARFAVERCGAGRRTVTVRVDDPPPGTELQVDFGRLGLVADGDKKRVCQGLIFTAVFSRHQFVWPTFSQTTEEVIRGFEAAWGYFGGVFPVVIPDNMKSIVITAEPTAPRFNDVFFEYAQSRGFVIDAARVRTPTDKPRVERVVQYVQKNFFAGETFVNLADCRARAETWCSTTAGMRIHGTTGCRPLEAFGVEEQPLLLARPGGAFDTPKWSDPKVHRDFHVRGGQGHLQRPSPIRGTDAAGPVRLGHGEVLLPRRTGEGPSPQTPRWAQHRSRRHAHGHRDLRHPGRRPVAAHGGRARRRRRPLRHGDSRHAAAVDQACARSTGSSGW